MARNMNWALDPRQQKRSAIASQTQVAKKARSESPSKVEEE